MDPSPPPRRPVPWSVFVAAAAVTAVGVWLFFAQHDLDAPRAQPPPRTAPILGLDDEATRRDREAERARTRAEWEAVRSAQASASAAPAPSAAPPAAPSASALP